MKKLLLFIALCLATVAMTAQTVKKMAVTLTEKSPTLLSFTGNIPEGLTGTLTTKNAEMPSKVKQGEENVLILSGMSANTKIVGITANTYLTDPIFGKATITASVGETKIGQLDYCGFLEEHGTIVDQSYATPVEISLNEQYVVDGEQNLVFVCKALEQAAIIVSYEISYTLDGSSNDIATFEGLALEAESAWYGDESGEDWFDGLGYQQRFKSGDYSFKNVCMPDWDSWVGFAYSNKTATTYTALSDQFNSCVGSGNNGSANYCVAYPDGTMWGDSFSVKVESGAKTVPGFYITNSAWVVKSILEGDGMTPGSFAQGDYFKIIVHALDADGNETAAREFYLADYRYDDEAKRYYINDWQYVDLSRMGEAAEFTFTFDSSRKNSYGITTPAYFCIDDFGAEGKEKEHEEPTSISTVISDNVVNSNAAMYNLNGVRVNKNFKGIVIKNGRKFVR